MAKRVILGIVFFFVVMAAVTFWIFGSIRNANAESQNRTEADFTTASFVVSELWKMEKKKGSQLISSYLFIKVKNEPIKLRIPWEGVSETQEALADKINDGDNIEVKVLKQQLAAARENGAFKAIGRFIMGDKREVTVYKLSAHNQLLVDKDIHGWNEAQVTLLNRMTENPLILLIPAFLLFAVIGYVKRRRAKTQQV